ncbi:chondroitinase-B domain-containing protein [Croceitalea rosinachiae]|uniref:Chondroitinase-B domain-containing protein n=1 Tax=Croceitalea rosinachiae TaxID=3075596 RepID=A0ABU3A5N8_9FLAO|nr:chondroitinase-B domain-containing protein [Croceitalea sp. F388]MDT0605479.1 chondroitinase-B domain-containing protein [Croceitalea sp. F388]
MIKKGLLVIGAALLLLSCGENPTKKSTYVKNITELNAAIKNAAPGDEIVMANGDWTDVEIRFIGYGNDKNPITLKAETAGEVIIKGKSDLKLGGEYLLVNGLYFTEGSSPTRSVIEFAINQDTVANHSSVRNCVVLDYNKGQRNQTDIWVQFKGRYNELDHSYIEGKANRGPTVRVDLEGNRSIKNYHKITNNYFGPRPPKGGPSAETIQIGNSYTSMAPSYTLVANNFFDRCNGEVEVISSKTNFNEFRNNVFYKSEGSLVTRHGNYCIVDGNYFIGDDNSEQIGGIRLIGTGHWVMNNYFYNLKGKVFRSPLAVMNGIPKSPLNRYIQVTDVVVAHNSWINCTSPLQFGVGSNVDQKDVLPASEIRSERPIRTIVANNLIYNEKSDKQPIIAHDSLDGITFKSNLINNQGGSLKYSSGFRQEEFLLKELEDKILISSGDLPEFELYQGFEFDQITKDLFGNSRMTMNSVGAISGTSVEKPNLMDLSKYGPDWYALKSVDNASAKMHAAGSVSELETAIQDAKSGDTIILTADRYELKSSMKINKKLMIRSADADSKVAIQYLGAPKTPVFEMNPKGHLILKGVNLKGTNSQYAFASLQSNMSSLYNLNVNDCEISDFDYVLKGYKYSFSEYIKFNSTLIKNCANGLELSAENDDRGDYNAENIFIDNCQFENVNKNVIDYYRGGYDESTVGGNLKVTNSSFKQCGFQEKNGVLINTYGIINVDISGNKFQNNKVELVARLWGAKNNSHSDNVIENSGKLVVEQNLPLKLMY